MTSRLHTHILTATIAAAALFTSAAQAQTTATTDPVGFITLLINGHGGSGSTALTFSGLGLTRTVEYQGSAETVGTNTLVDNEATWTDDLFNGANGDHFVEITSGPGAGTTYDIADTIDSSNTIQLAQNLAAGVANGSTFKVRKHWTIGTVFGPNNEAGLQGGTATTADQIRVLDAATGTYSTYFYSTGGLPGVGWRKVGAGNASQTNTRIYPDEGLLATRNQSANVNVVLMGAVKLGQTSSPVLAGLNIVANPYAAPLTLASSGLYTGSSATGVAAGNSTTADQVRIYDAATGTYNAYFYSSGGLPGVGWRRVGGGSTDQSAVQVPVGSSILISRQGSSGFDWIAPQHPASI